MIAESSKNTPAKSAPLKRSLFNKPSWSKPENIGSPAELFHRANHTYLDIAAEAERKRKAKLARKERERARQEGSKEPEGKRRRVSDESQDDDDHSSSDDNGKISKQENGHLVKAKSEVSAIKCASPSKPKTSPKSLSKRYEEAVAAPKNTGKSASHRSEIIDLDEEDRPILPPDEDDDLCVTTIQTSKPPALDNEPASDEEFPELARKAREKARRKRLEAELEHATLDPPASISGSGYRREPQPVHQPTPPPPAPDSVVRILITSRIANTGPLAVDRKISQRLKDVRVTWCERQGFAKEFISNVFLTWRGKRLFDVTTCKSLGIAVDQDGNVLTKAQKDILGEEDGRIHMEAMTKEILEEYKKGKRHAAGEDEAEDHDNEEEVLTQPKEEAQVRIILKAKGVDDFKLIVKPVRRIFHRQDPFALLIYADYLYIEDSQCFPNGQESGARKGGFLAV